MTTNIRNKREEALSKPLRLHHNNSSPIRYPSIQDPSIPIPPLFLPTRIFSVILHLFIMRTSSVVAAAALLGCASAGVHRMKLQKIPLGQQLVCARSIFLLCSCAANQAILADPFMQQEQQNANIGDLAGALAQKYGAQKVMGQPSEETAHDDSIDADKGGHVVPVDNFMNAQCRSPPPLGTETG